MPLRLPVVASVLLFLCMAEASAAALTRVVTSAGALAVLGALLVMKSWPAQFSAAALPTAGGALAVAGGALWWWRARTPTEPRTALRNAAQVSARFASAAVVQLPAQIDRAGLQAALRRQFVALQVAWDRGDMLALGYLTTPEMLAELCLERPADQLIAAEATDVVTVQADLLGFEVMGQDFVVSVEFSGLIRESAHGGAVPFRELWMLTRSNRGADGWRLARHQALL